MDRRLRRVPGFSNPHARMTRSTPTQLMQLSSEYPDFCEVTVDAAADRASYDLCAVDPAPGGMAGFAVIEDPARAGR